MAIGQILLCIPTILIERRCSRRLITVFKDGELVVKDGEVVKVTWGTTHVVRPEYDASVEKHLKDYFERYMTMKVGNFKISDDEITEDGRGSLTVHPTVGGAQ